MRRPLGRSSLTAATLAVLLTAGAAILPPAIRPVAGPAGPLLAALDAPVALAAGDLAISTATRYTVVPERAVVRVTVDITARNEKPNSVSGGVVTRYFYDGVNLGVQPEATRFRATQGGSTVRVSVDRREGYRLVTVRFRANVFFQQTAKVRLSYDLPAGEPRSSSDVRVGPAFASFLAWAFGDRGTVRIDVPAAFEVDLAGAEMERSTTDDGVQVYRATTSDPVEWFTWVNARNDEGLTRQRIDLPAGDEIVVRAWPEDGRWRSRVATLLQRGVPELVTRIGLPWPVDGSLEVFEVHTPLLEGYAGFYDPDRDEITISEDLDDVTIVHEASHAWFNPELFTERWITEGLAEEYAAQVVNELGGEAPGPAAVSREADEAFALGSWPPPSPIEDDEADAREEYGYSASFRVVNEVVESVGEEGMRRVFAAAHARTTAYTGDGGAERTAIPNDWRRFVDLAEEVGGAEGVAELVAEWALTEREAGTLDQRAAARRAYAELVDAGGAWAAPRVARLALDRWSFEPAETAMDQAMTILALREELATAAATEDLDAPAYLEAAYEAAEDLPELEAVEARATLARTSLQAVAAAGDAAAAPRDWLVELGLSDKTPDADLVAARTAWEAGDYATAATTAQLVVGTLAVAGEAGTARAVIIAAVVAVVLLLLLVLLLLVRRSRRRRRLVIPEA